jgi:hypothetical protein
MINPAYTHPRDDTPPGCYTFGVSRGSGVPGKTMLQLARSLAGAKRQAARDARTIEEQLTLLDTRPGKSVAEHARLTREQ